MKINPDKYVDIFKEFKEFRNLTDLEVFNFDSTIDCYSFVRPQLNDSPKEYKIVCVNNIDNNIVAVYTEDEFLTFWKESILYAEKNYFGTGFEQNNAKVEIGRLVTIIKNNFYKQSSKEILVNLKTASALIKLFGVWTHQFFESSAEEYVDYYRENIHRVFIKLQLRDVFRERENAALKNIVLKQLEDAISNANLIKAKEEVLKIKITWDKIGYVGKEREGIEIRFSQLINNFEQQYREEAKREGSDVYNYEHRKMSNWTVKEIKPRPFDFSGDDLSIDPRFW